jgi:putative zinc finger protein
MNAYSKSNQKWGSLIMTCEETEQSLSLYIDDFLSLPARAAVDEHLNECPVCRACLANFRAIRRALNLLPRAVPPADLASSITDALMIEAGARQRQPKLSFSVRLAHWLQPRLMPYSVGSFASVILFISMFIALRPHFVALHEAAQSGVNYGTVYLLSGPAFNLNEPVRPEDFAASRAPFAEQSPSLNPGGALAALTRSHAHPDPQRTEDADDMVVVTDVFSNGAASLAGVVQAPRHRRMLDDFESALRQNAAFVPASMDGRPDTMRVVFAVQKVDVRERNF